MAKRKPAENESDSPVSFEESLEELQAIVADLEDGAVGLEASLARFERGIGLLRLCYSILESAEAKVEILTRFQGDDAVTAPFDSTATFDSTQDRAGPAPRTSRGNGAESGSNDDSGKPSLF